MWNGVDVGVEVAGEKVTDTDTHTDRDVGLGVEEENISVDIDAGEKGRCERGRGGRSSKVRRF